jgi:hypothetical protein
MFWGRVLQGAWGGSSLPVTTPSAEVQFGASPGTITASTTAEVTASFTLNRGGDTSVACSVDWTAGGTMTAADYVTGQLLAGTASFAAGIGISVVTLRIKAAAAGTPDKTIAFALSNPLACDIVGPATQTITVDMPGLVTTGPEYPTPSRVLTVETAAELRTALEQTTGDFPAGITITGGNRAAPLRALDRVIVEDGTYAGNFNMASGGTAGSPVLIMARNTLGARFTGRFTLNRSYVWLVGLDFDGENSLTSTAGWTYAAPFTRAHRCRERRFDSADSATTETSGRFAVSVQAADCEMWFCELSDIDGRFTSGKANGAGAMRRLHIYRTVYKDTKDALGNANARECIQLGQTQAGGDGLPGSLSPVHNELNCLIEECLFQNLHQGVGDENETISIKSSKNTILRCTFIDTQYLNIRFGNDNRVEGCWFERVSGTKNRGIGVFGDRNVIIGNVLRGSGNRILVHAGNQDMTCAAWDKPNADTFGSPPYTVPRTVEPSWPSAWARPWSTNQRFDGPNGVPVDTGGVQDADNPIARETWVIANNGPLAIGGEPSATNWWQARNTKVRSHTGAITTQNAYGSWANVPTASPTTHRETGSTYSATVDAAFLPLPAAAKRLTPGEVGPLAPYVAPGGGTGPIDFGTWWKLPIRSGRAWAAGVSYWYDRTSPTDAAAPRYVAEEADVALIDMGTGSSIGIKTGFPGGEHVQDWDGVIGGPTGSAMDTTKTQFDWTGADVYYGFDDVIANLPTGGSYATDGSAWLVWVVVLFPATLRTDGATEAASDPAVWDQFIAGTHDLRMQKFGERCVRRMALTGHPLKRLIIDIHHEMNQSNIFQVWPGTRTKYKNAMTRAITQIRNGANAYEAGAGDVIKFLHRPGYNGNIGAYQSYIPVGVDALGLSYHPGNTAPTTAKLTDLFNGALPDTYGFHTDLIAASDALGLPICFPEWSPRFEAGIASPIADIATERFYDEILTRYSDRLIGDAVYHQNIRDLTPADFGGDAAALAAWKRMVPLRKTKWSGIKS